MYKSKAAIKALAVLSLSAFLSAGAEPAQAWWFFGKKKHGSQETKREKKKRDISAASVGLVPGNPPALYWKPEKDPRAVVLCLHELGMYNGVFDNLGSRMAKEGLAVYAIDLRGFGGWSEIKSKESRMDLDNTLADLKASVEVLHKLHPALPVFVLGEAMGGALALKAAAEYPDLIQGTISAAPGGEHYKTTQNYLTIAGKLVSTGPNHNCSYGEDLVAMATKKTELQEALAQDPKVRMDLAPREMMDCQFFMYKTRNMAKQIKNTPVLVVHGANDGESKEIGSKRVFDKLGTKDKQYLKVEDGDHYTFEDIKVSDSAFNATLAWIDKHLNQQ
ncbi:MAG: lysophospholipase [Candidatus Obscuribacterales bacterium]|nr:lysophospholipase [Candidatus Obscuribacterales bacterium]